MRVLALTHAHLYPSGLSPVSCERADSIIKSWSEKLNWDVTVVWTKGTKWAGIWPEGKNINNIKINELDPGPLLIQPSILFKEDISNVLRKNFLKVPLVILKKIVSKGLSEAGKYKLDFHPDIIRAKKWGKKILNQIKENPAYDFIFCTIGYGDEYLLSTSYILSLKLGIPLVVDYRDLWSDHHENRFKGSIYRAIQNYEKKVHKRCAIVSTPQKQDSEILRSWSPATVYQLSHSAYIDPLWTDGKANPEKLILTYAGKAYLKGNGIHKIIDLAQILKNNISLKVEINLFTDEPAAVQDLAVKNYLGDIINSKPWIAPADLWKELRNSHFLIITDSGIASGRTLIPTKTYLFALTGRKIVFLLNFEDNAIQEFTGEVNCGSIFIDPKEAAEWIIGEVLNNRTAIAELPPIRTDIPARINQGIKYGETIEKRLKPFLTK